MRQLTMNHVPISSQVNPRPSISDLISPRPLQILFKGHDLSATFYDGKQFQSSNTISGGTRPRYIVTFILCFIRELFRCPTTTPNRDGSLDLRQNIFWKSNLMRVFQQLLNSTSIKQIIPKNQTACIPCYELQSKSLKMPLGAS